MIGPQAIVIVAAVHACRLLSVSIATAATAHGAWGGPLRWPVGGGIIGSGGARGVLAFHSVPAVAAGLARNDGGVSVRSHCSGQRCGGYQLRWLLSCFSFFCCFVNSSSVAPLL